MIVRSAWSGTSIVRVSLSMFRKPRAAFLAALVTLFVLVLPSSALASVEFIPSGNMTVTVFIQDDGDMVGGVPANHKWQLIQETGPTPDTTTSLGLRTVAPLAGENYNGLAPTATGASAVYGVCQRIQSDTGLDCEGRNGYSFSEIVVSSGAGNDFVDASRVTMPVQLSGGEGNDLLIGGAGADYLVGGNGDDTVDGNCGTDLMFGSTGTDTLSYANSRAFTVCAAHTGGIFVALNGTADDVDGENVVTTSNFEIITGTGGSDVIKLGAAAMTIAAGDGDDIIEARNGVADTINCGGGTDRALLDAATIDTAITACEELDRSAPAPVNPTPPMGGGNCPSTQTSLVVNGARLCADSQTQVSGGLTQLRGNVSVDGFLDFKMTTPLVVDTARRTATYAGPATIVGRSGRSAANLLNGSVNGSFPLAASFAITSRASSAANIANVALGVYTPSNGLVDYGVVDGVKLQVTTNTGTATYPAGAQFVNRALSAVGTAGFSRSSGIVSTIKGCTDAVLPLGNVSRIAEISRPCMAYSPAYGAWELTATARLASMITSNIAARTGVNADIDEFDMNFNSKPAPLGYNTQITEGGLRVTGLKDPSRTRIYGDVGTSWDTVPGAPAAGRLRIVGALSMDTGRRELHIRGNGSLTVSGNEVTSGEITLDVATGTPEVPAGIKARVDLYTLSGFITGSATVMIDGQGFFASGKLTVGFPAGAPVTNQVNSKIRSVLACDWGVLGDWCPYVTGWTISAEAAVSNKGAGARANVSVLYGTFWWIGSDNSFHADMGFGSSKQLVDVLRSKTRAGTFAPEGLKADDVLDAASGKTDTWTIPAQAKIAALRLDGSLTGDLKVTDPTGRVVLDTAAGVTVDGAAFGRDPQQSGKASFGLFAPAIKPGVWTVSTAGAAPFTSIEPLMSLPSAQGKVTSAKVVGARAGTKALVAGRSKLRIAYSVPAGSDVSLRASTLDGSLTKPVAPASSKNGVATWTVSKEWAGKIRLLAVTERDGIPIATETFATVYSVTRPVLSAPAKVKAKRGTKGSVVFNWSRVPGATGYEVTMCVGALRSSTRFVTKAPKLITTPRTAFGMRMRVRARTDSTVGTWSTPVKLTGLRGVNVSGPKRVLQPTCKL